MRNTVVFQERKVLSLMAAFVGRWRNMYTVVEMVEGGGREKAD